ncbi:MAG: peptidylprolyl isomerase [Planctomycetes bacterium]|nr:peptidylprolyl isomerase [Planctomycetota bacterium]
MSEPAKKATIVTNKGTIELELWPDKAPKHVENLAKLAKDGFYDGLIFHRVIPGFMIQCGCPQGKGTGGPGWNIDAEFNQEPFVKGVLGMARAQSPNSAGSQFFVCVDDAHFLTGQYTAFGKVTAGQDVADAIAEVSRDGQDRPHDEIKIESLRVE